MDEGEHGAIGFFRAQMVTPDRRSAPLYEKSLRLRSPAPRRITPHD